MDEQQQMIEQMQKIVALGPFIMMRYVTLAGDSTLEMDSKIAFAQTLNREEYAAFFGDISQTIDPQMGDAVLGGDPEFILELIEQLKTILSVVYEQKEQAFGHKKTLFDFAVDIRLAMDNASDIDELSEIHQSVLSTLASSLNLIEELDELEAADS